MISALRPNGNPSSAVAAFHGPCVNCGAPPTAPFGEWCPAFSPGDFDLPDDATFHDFPTSASTPSTPPPSGDGPWVGGVDGDGRGLSEAVDPAVTAP